MRNYKIRKFDEMKWILLIKRPLSADKHVNVLSQYHNLSLAIRQVEWHGSTVEELLRMLLLRWHNFVNVIGEMLPTLQSERTRQDRDQEIVR